LLEEDLVLPEAVDVSVYSSREVVFERKPFARLNVVASYGQRAPIVGAMVVVGVPPPEPDAQFGKGVQDPATHEIFSGPPTFTYPLLQIIGTKAPDTTLVLSSPSVGRLYAPFRVIVTATDAFWMKANRGAVGHRPVAEEIHTLV
jgi:hypothetical protein